MAKKQNSNGSAELNIGVEFGGVSIGDTSARIGFRVSRSVMQLALADKFFRSKRLQVTVTLGGKDDIPGQKKLKGMEETHTIEAVADIKHYSVKPDEMSAGLAFSKSEVDVSELSKFAKQSGRISMICLGDAPKHSEHDDDEERDYGGPAHPDVEAGKGRPHGTPALEAAAKAHADAQAKGSARNFALKAPVSELVRFGMPKEWTKKLNDKEITEMGHLHALHAEGKLKMRAVGLSATSFPTLEEAFKKWLATLDPTAAEVEAAYAEGALAAGDENARHHDNPHGLGPLADAWRKGYRDTEHADSVPDDEGK